MTAGELALRSPDFVTLRVPMGLRLRDAADLSIVSDDLLVTATEDRPNGRSFALSATAGGMWTAPRVPGLRPAIAADPALWAATAQRFEIRISDPRRRYLPLRMMANLPAEAAIAWPEFASLPSAISAAVLPSPRPPGYRPDFVPLFPGIARVAPGARAEVRAHLAIANAGVPAGNAGFAVMTVSIGGVVRGVGVADGDGAILVSFAYPLLPTPTPAERAAGTTRIEWRARIAVYFGGLAAAADGAPPLLPDILGQLNRTPARVLARLGSTTRLGEQILGVGAPLVLRSARTAPAKPSSLFIVPA
jgi:hypothetical protein